MRVRAITNRRLLTGIAVTLVVLSATVHLLASQPSAQTPVAIVPLLFESSAGTVYNADPNAHADYSDIPGTVVKVSLPRGPRGWTLHGIATIEHTGFRLRLAFGRPGAPKRSPDRFHWGTDTAPREPRDAKLALGLENKGTWTLQGYFPDLTAGSYDVSLQGTTREPGVMAGSRRVVVIAYPVM
jgi:hypothetical protein